MNLNEIKSKITQVDARIREKELLRASLEGQRDAAMKTLKDTFGVDTVEAAEALVVKKQAELAELQQEQQVLEADLTALEAKNA